MYVFCSQLLESQMKIKEQQVMELEVQAQQLAQKEPDQVEEIERRKAIVAERSVWKLL